MDAGSTVLFQESGETDSIMTMKTAKKKPVNSVKDKTVNCLTYANLTPDAFKKLMESLSPKEKAALLYSWE